MEESNKDNYIFDKVRVANEKLLCLTESASQKIKELIKRESAGSLLRVKIVGGGCNGLSYKMDFTNLSKLGDILVESFDVKLIIDPKTALYIKGTTLSYSNDLVGGGFQFNNPNAKASCSCGESFSL